MPSENTKISEFKQYQKSDKTRSIIYVDLESLIKKLMNVKIILKNHPKQKKVDIFQQVFQGLRYRHLKTQKISMMQAEVKIA